MKKTEGISIVKARNDFNLRRFVKDYSCTLTSSGPLLLAFIFATYTLQWLTVMGFLPTLLIVDFGIGKGMASVFTAFMVAMNIPGNLAGGWLMHKGLGREKLICTAILIMGISSFVIYFSAMPFWIRYGGCLAFSGFGGLLPASVLSGAPVHAPAPDQIGTTNGLIMQGGQLGQLMGPPVLALLVSHTGTWQSAPFLLIFTALTGAALSLVLLRK
jgi:MFS family permease